MDFETAFSLGYRALLGMLYALSVPLGAEKGSGQAERIRSTCPPLWSV